MERLERVTAEVPDTRLSCESRRRLVDLYRTLGRFDTAAKTTLELSARTPPGPERDELRLSAGRFFEQARDWPAAFDQYQAVAALGLLPKAAGAARVRKADVLYSMKKFPESLDEFRRITGMDPETHDLGLAYYRIGLILDCEMKNYPEALEAYQTVLTSYAKAPFVGEAAARLLWIQRRHIGKKSLFW